MPENSTYSPLSKNIRSNDDLDYQFLREKCISLIQEMSRSLWTDYNTHDPGITLLEILSYAITDLGYRLSLPVQDLIYSGDKRNFLTDHFHLAPDVLPCKALTELDYRMVFIDLKGVRNSWLKPYKKTVYADCKNHVLSYELEVWEGLGQKDRKSFELKGLHHILLDLEPGVSLESIKRQVFRQYHAHRNLCEDLVEVTEVGTQEVQVCALIDLAPEADEEQVSALIQWQIEQYFSPDLRFYSFQEMLEKGYTTDQIVEGPLLKHGFLDPREVDKANLRTEVRQSDIIQLIMNVAGVKAVRDIRINNCEEGAGSGAWVLSIDPGKKPGLCAKSKFNFYKGLLPVNVDEQRVQTIKNGLTQDQYRNQYRERSKNYPFPEPAFYALDEFFSIRNDFPEVYGVGSIGLPESASAERKTKANQFKAYLTFFDQILASYFKHLSQVKSLLSVFTTSERTYFSQSVTDIGDFGDFLPDFYTDTSFQEGLFSSFDRATTRNQKFKDHLLARFAEKFSDYAFLMKKIYGQGVDQQILETKARFLGEYGKFSANRATAMNYFRQSQENLWNTTNTSGFEKRVALLAGIRRFMRKNLARSFVEIYPLTNAQGDAVYRWRIRDQHRSVLLSATEDYPSRSAAHREIYLAIQLVKASPRESLVQYFQELDGIPAEVFSVGCFRVTRSPSGRFSFSIVDPSVPDSESPDYIIASQYRYFSFSNFPAALLAFKDFMDQEFDDEGMFLVENLLTRPDFDSESEEEKAFLPFCEEDCQPGSCLDPYSYRVTVVLPGNTFRFADRDFRDYLENLIREELPAHVLAKICWIGKPQTGNPDQPDQLAEFEEAYRDFLFGLSQGSFSAHKAFIRILSELRSIYPTGTLYNCEKEDESEALRDTIILGRTNLGTI
jgi:hypothetical protein